MLATVKQFNKVMLMSGLGAEPEIVYSTPAETWIAVNEKCLEMMPLKDCQGLLGTQPIYFKPESKPSLGMGWYILIGAIFGFSAGQKI